MWRGWTEGISKPKKYSFEALK